MLHISTCVEEATSAAQHILMLAVPSTAQTGFIRRGSIVWEWVSAVKWCAVVTS